MGRVINAIAVTLVGCGILAASGTLEDSRKLHDEVRGRARAQSEMGLAAWDADAIRAALRDDPAFAGLLEELRRRTLAWVRNPRYGEDAFQETLLKTWKGRPELFLKGHDELLRYLRSATRNNLLTLLGKDPRPAGTKAAGPADLDEVADARTEDPLEATADADLLHRLVERLGPAEKAVLESRLSGAKSDRGVAAATGASRYAVGRASENIRRELGRLLAGECESAA